MSSIRRTFRTCLRRPLSLESFEAVWSFAKLSHQDAALYGAISSACIHRLSEFGVQDLTSSAWAFASLSNASAPLREALALGTKQRLGQFAARDMAGSFWVMARLESTDREQMDLLSSQALHLMAQFKPQDAGEHVPFIQKKHLLHRR